MIMELLPVSATAKAPAGNFTGDVYLNPIYRGEEPSIMRSQPVINKSGRLVDRAKPINIGT